MKYLALGSLLMDYMAGAWHDTDVKYETEKRKQVFYFSMEFLIGRLMDAALINLGIKSVVEEGLREFGTELSRLEEIEPDAGLATAALAGLRPASLIPWHPWGLPAPGSESATGTVCSSSRSEMDTRLKARITGSRSKMCGKHGETDEACMVRFGGTVRMNLGGGPDGRLSVEYQDYEPILAVPYDMPVPGFRNGTVNTLRLWSAETDGPGFDFAMFSKGDYEKATESQTAVNAITNVLYPDDSTERGKLLRLKQEYFFTSAGVQSILRRMKQNGVSPSELHRYAAIHINDTHPALAIPELMQNPDGRRRIELGYRMERYGSDGRLHQSYDSGGGSGKMGRTDVPEAAPADLYVVEEINRRFTAEISRRYNGDWNRLNAMSVIQDGVVKMAYLSIVGSHSVNGVAELHTEILKNQELKNFHEFYPGKFNNKTNGISHRRWLLEANPELSDLINETIGTDWQLHPSELGTLRRWAEDSAFLERAAAVKRTKKEQLAAFIKEKYDIAADPSSVFDIQVKPGSTCINGSC